MEITVTIDKLKETLSKLEAFKRLEVLVGIPGNKSVRKKVENEKEPTNAEIGFINEFGSALNHIPPRPFLIPGIKKVKPELSDIFKKTAKNILGGISPIRSGLEEGGQKAVSSAKNIIRTQENFKPLSEKTIRLREQKGFKGKNALIRTGQLLNSLTYVVREK